MKVSYRRALAATMLAACAALGAPVAAQQAIEPKSVEGPSERFVRVIQHIAWSRMPSKLEAEGVLVEVDKTDPQKFLLPSDDARRIIVIANRSATAVLCDMNEAALANFIALMNAERASNRWTREQLHMIKWIYIAVVSVRTETRTIKEVEAEGQAGVAPANDKPDADKPAPLPVPEEAKRTDFSCPPDLKVKVNSEIERYVMAVNDHLGVKIDKP